jgi:hypothetical protein
VLFRSGDVLGVLIPLVPQPAAGDTPLALRQAGGCFVLSIANRAGPRRDFTRDELHGWTNGFYCELWSTAKFADLDALWAHAKTITIEDQPAGGGRNRRTVVLSAGVMLELVHNPWSEEIVRAEVNGEGVDEPHFSAVALATGAPLLDPPTLYGEEALAVFPP